jgi:Fur family transcriptional regulator, ferric uptake regulator
VERETRQRQAILAVLKAARGPLSRDEILAAARRRVPQIGPATINRHIRALTAEKHLLGVDYPGQPIRYELPSPAEHVHFICRRCGRVFDWQMPIPSVTVTAPAGFAINGHEVIFYGRCPACGRS